MVAVEPTRRYTPEAYLALERAAACKSECIDGYIVAMSGATPQHDRIAGDVYIRLALQLQEGPCDVFSSDLRIKNETTLRHNL